MQQWLVKKKTVAALSKPLVFRKDSLMKLLVFYYDGSQGYNSRRFSSSTDYDKCEVLKD
jgi:hypothetical protein